MTKTTDFIEASLTYLFEDKLGKVEPEHKEEVRQHITSLMVPHINSVPPWMYGYLETLDLGIRKYQEYMWTDYLFHLMTLETREGPHQLPQGYVIFRGEVMTEDQMNAVLQKQRLVADQVRGILDNEQGNIISFITDCDTPVYVNTVVGHFGSTSEEREVYRNAVWHLISHGQIEMNSNLTLTSRTTNV